MEIYKNFDMEIDEREIFRLMGYGENMPEGEILDSIRSEIEKSKGYIKPTASWEMISISTKTEDSIVLENSVVFRGEYISEKLEKCKDVLVSVTSIGSEIDEIIKSSFDNGDYLRGMIVDSIGSTAVEYVNKLFWNRILGSMITRNLGITSRLSPGTGGWDISGQADIFSCIDRNKSGVELTDSYLMVPLKSTSVVYGIGEGIGITRAEHICSECSMKNCAYRMDKMVEIKILGNSIRAIYGEKGSSLLELLRNKGIEIGGPCSGRGTCGKCRIRVIRGRVRPSDSDRIHLSQDDINDGIRLACTIRLSDPLEIEILNDEGSMNILTDGCISETDVNPRLFKKYLLLDPPSLQDQRSDLWRIREALGAGDIFISRNLMCKIPESLRNFEFKTTAVVYENILVDIEKGDTRDRLFGAAVDIGTTTVACYLVDMAYGRVIDVESGINSQKPYGADVISRINYTIENKDGSKTLKDKIVNQINDMLSKMCKRQNVSLKEVYTMTVAGNTTMLHLLLDLPCKFISLTPYIPAVLESLNIPGSELGVDVNGFVNILPGVSGYVGSDITAGILACGMDESKDMSLLLDLGTNGEIVLGNSEGLFACSAAAGPAFEGASIKYGVGGIKGAISKIDLSKDKVYETIGNVKPCGICGSGVLDIVSQLLKYSIIDETGRMMDIDEIDLPMNIKERLSLHDGVKEFRIEGDIVFTQKDVREVQLAAAAVSAGIKILMKEKGIYPEDIKNVFIAGGFGNYMNVESAVIVGLIPKILSGKIKSIGNSAGAGARMCLLSGLMGSRIERIARGVKYIELSGRQDFQEYFIDSMMLGGNI